MPSKKTEKVLVADAAATSPGINQDGKHDTTDEAEKAIKARKNQLGGYFVGDREILVDVLNPHVANWLKSKTASFKKLMKIDMSYSCSYKSCPNKGKNVSHLESAHPIGSERPLLILAAINALYPDATVQKFDIKKVLATVKRDHDLLQIALICRDCHSRHGELKPSELTTNTFDGWRKTLAAAESGDK